MAIPFIHVQARGSYRELGRAVGEAAREQCRAAIAFYEEHFVAMAGIDFAEAERQALDYLPYAQKYLPQCVEELEGMAEGCGLPFIKLLVPNCAEEFTCPADADDGTSPHGGQAGDSGRPEGPAPLAGHFCTGVAAMTADRHVVGHNMDWYVVDADKNVLFDLTVPDGTRIVCISGVPYLPAGGMNSHGFAYVGNSVYSNDNRIGVPNVFVRRWALEAPTIEEAASRACMPMRARGSNHTFGDRSGRIWNVETSACGAALIEAEGHYAHANHYEVPAMAFYEGYHKEESRLRVQAAEAALAAGLTEGHDPGALVERVLQSHANRPDSICGHPNPETPVADRIMSVASMVCDLDRMELKACAGPPCENPYQTFSAAAV